jgi:hypothetical protein
MSDHEFSDLQIDKTVPIRGFPNHVEITFNFLWTSGAVEQLSVRKILNY